MAGVLSRLETSEGVPAAAPTLEAADLLSDPGPVRHLGQTPDELVTCQLDAHGRDVRGVGAWRQLAARPFSCYERVPGCTERSGGKSASRSSASTW
jgi:hypothetical protein